jgi:phytoene dehydrogenase-like protein
MHRKINVIMMKVPVAIFLLFMQLQLQLNFQTASSFLPMHTKELSNKRIAKTRTTTTTTTAFAFNWFGLGKNGSNVEDTKGADQNSSIYITNTQRNDFVSSDWLSNLPSFATIGQAESESADIVIIGGGVSGLAAAITAAEAIDENQPKKNIILLEANEKLGGRVTSEKTDDGFVLDEGFAVFIEEYPEVKKILDYDALELKQFLPGAKVKLKGRKELARVADPLRNPGDIVDSVLSPIGSLLDKVKVLPLVLNVRLSSVEAIFNEKETDTESALIERWGFSDDFINTFLKPFLEGIYLSPLSQQSSRMFSFVFKMFSDGSAALPKGGMIAVTNQLVEKAESLGVQIITQMPVTRVLRSGGKDNDNIIVECKGDTQRCFETSFVVVATDGRIAKKIISNVKGFESLKDIPDQPQLSVGCLYYAFEGKAPVEEPILVLNGVTEDNEPVNNVCFPSMVNEGYAPEGYNLCR